jgi:hypothetical protein
MAFLSIPGFNTFSTGAISSGSGLLPIDSNVAAAFAVQLGANYTFASISDGINYEIIKIDGVSGANLVIERAQDGTTASAFPIGSCIRYVWTTEGISAVAAGGSLVLTGTGVVTATQTGPNAWTISVEMPTIDATLPIEVMGGWPAWEVAFQGNYGACCCGSGGGGSGGTITEITGSGLVTVAGGTGPTVNIDVAVLNLIAGTNVTITGTYPNFTINASGGGGGSGTVTSVSGAGKITISGSPTVNPTVNLNANFSAGAIYNGVTFDKWGTITAIDSVFQPVNLITTTTTCVLIGIAGTPPSGAHATINLASATTSDAGIAKLAIPDAAHSRDSSDATSIVTPKGLDAVLNAYVPPAPTPVTQVSSSTFTADAPSSYTNGLSSSILVPVLAAGQVAIINAAASVTDTSVTSPPLWGLGVFVGSSLVQGVKAIYTGTHFMRFIVTGPQAPTTYTLKTSALSGTMSVVAQELDATILPP